ncbi:MAG: deoxyhypusine synthase [Thermoplasmata archaeon]|nr:deoxyhypusine synthase [Thermoplasmata archaeon]MCI4356074.1 deoxyhypusine synthase [Thermoplasmata archaeon]
MSRKVEDIRVDDGPSLDTFARRLEAGGGFSAKGVGAGVGLLARILGDKGMTKFLSFPADIVATGTRGVLAGLIRDGYVDAVVTTCGTLDHDIARAFRPYYHGEWSLDDVALRRKGLYRLGNLVIPEGNYGPVVERFVQPLLRKLWKGGKRALSTRDLVWAIGEALGPKRGEGSIARAAFERQVPVFVPGITDGAVGSQMWLFWQDHRAFSVDLMSDEQALSDLVFTAKRSGAVMLGGGISKHHTIWWNQFRDGLDAALYITTAVEWDGSLSGARTREAVSWGKVKPNAEHATVEGDVTVLFPLMVGAALERLRA